MLYTVYGMSESGNCYKVKLLLEQLRQPYQWREVNILNGESRTDKFLAMNPNGQTPVLAIDNDRFLAESNAILVYLAEGSGLLPVDKFERAQVLQWMFFEQYSHEPYIAVARFINKFLPPDHARQTDMPRLHERGYRALDVMEKYLASRNYFVGEKYSTADIALYAYTHVAADGGFDLARYPVITAWLQRIAAQPDFVEM